MEKVTEKEVAKVERKYDFYCDKCGTHLGTSHEHEDGWYQEYGKVEFSDPGYSGTVYYGNLCDGCKKSLEAEINAKKIALFKKYGLRER